MSLLHLVIVLIHVSHYQWLISSEYAKMMLKNTKVKCDLLMPESAIKSDYFLVRKRNISCRFNSWETEMDPINMISK